MYDIFSFKQGLGDFQIHSYDCDSGLVSHLSCEEVDPDVSFVFLANAPVDFSMSCAGLFTYVFYLDTEPVEREFLAQNYQLVYSDEPCGLGYDNWVEMVVRYLCACLKFPSMPAFDWHDVASVLLEVKQHRLHFNVMPFEDSLKLNSADGGFNRLLAVVFTSMERAPCWEVVTEFNRYDGLADLVAGGAAKHPYEERLVMFLGDKICSNKPTISTKNPLIPVLLRAIY